MIYLDHAATTPLHPQVLDAMLPWLREEYGNPSSIHASGRRARAAIDKARDLIAAELSADYSEITFTSGGTEADNLAILGIMEDAEPPKNRLIVSAIEHHAILHAAKRCESRGQPVTYLPVDHEGRISTDSLASVMGDDVALVSIMHGNNEIGTIQQIRELCSISHQHGALFHTDAVQSFCVLPIDVQDLGCDLLSVSAHKVYGPKGVGALWTRTGTKLTPRALGGAQERERRGGTENVAGIVGFGEAVRVCSARREAAAAHVKDLRDHLQAGLEANIEGLEIHGSQSHRLPGILNVSVPGIEGSALVMNLDRRGIAVSTGAACSSGSLEPSHVLSAIGVEFPSGVRFSLGFGNTTEEVDRVVGVFTEIVTRLNTM